jgi:hypothetical protein
MRPGTPSRSGHTTVRGMTHIRVARKQCGVTHSVTSDATFSIATMDISRATGLGATKRATVGHTPRVLMQVRQEEERQSTVNDSHAPNN